MTASVAGITVLSSNEIDAQYGNTQNKLDRTRTNEIYIGMDWGDIGPIISCQKMFTGILSPFGAYIIASQGLQSKEYIKDHLRVGAGAVIYLKRESWKNLQLFFGGGGSLHSYGKDMVEYKQLDDKWLYKPYSGDVCVGGRYGRFNVKIEFLTEKLYGDVVFGGSFGGLAKQKNRCINNKPYKKSLFHHKQYSKRR